MVNLKNTLFLVMGLTFFSCATDYYITEGGGTRSRWYYKTYLNKRINPKDIGITPKAVYLSSYFYKNNKRYTNKSAGRNHKTYFVSYENGTSYLFYKDTAIALNKESFNPNKGNICFLIKRYKKPILKTYSFVDGGHFLTSKIKVRGDTIITHSKNSPDEFYTFFIKQEFPKEWLNFTPDY